MTVLAGGEGVMEGRESRQELANLLIREARRSPDTAQSLRREIDRVRSRRESDRPREALSE